VSHLVSFSFDGGSFFPLCYRLSILDGSILLYSFSFYLFIHLTIHFIVPIHPPPPHFSPPRDLSPRDRSYVDTSPWRLMHASPYNLRSRAVFGRSL
jgi:hypothetical protein